MRAEARAEAKTTENCYFPSTAHTKHHTATTASRKIKGENKCENINNFFIENIYSLGGKQKTEKEKRKNKAHNNVDKRGRDVCALVGLTGGYLRLR